MALVKRSDWRPTLAGSFLSDFFDDDGFFNSPWLSGQNVPAVNVKENDKNFEVELAAPGFDKKDFNISLEQGLMTISAEKKSEEEEKEDNYTRKEFGYKRFSRSFSLPKNVSEEDIQAKYENGLLKMVIKKRDAPEAKPRKTIEIR